MAPTDNRPMYEQIYESLRQAIISGQYQVGDRVPSEKELADQYGVSRITTKRALEMLAAEGWVSRQPGRGSFVTDERPSAPRPAANAAPETEAELIGLIMTDFDESYGSTLLAGIEKAAAEVGCFVVLRRSLGDPAREEKAIQALLKLGVDGMIVFPAQNEHFSAEILKLVINQFPLVLVDRHLKGVAAASVSTDNVGAARRGIDYLLDLGHSNIGLLTPPPMDTTAIEDRLEGFIQAHAERGVMVDRSLWLTVTATLPSNFRQPNIDRDIELIKEHLRKHPHLTAFFAIEYNIALLAREAARQLGLRVPEDLSILCFDSPRSPLLGDFRFTHMLQDEEGMGRTALQSVLALKNGEKVPSHRLLDARLCPGESTAPPRK